MQKSQKKQLGRAILASAVAASVLSSKKPTSRRRRGRKGAKGTSAVAQLLASAANPFHVSPPKLGFGCMGDSAREEAFFRGSAQNNAYTVVVLRPNVMIGGTLSPFLQVYSNTLDTGLLSAAAVQVQKDPANLAILQAKVNELRPITAGLRVNISTMSSERVGKIYAGQMTVSQTALEAKTFASLESLAELQPVVPSFETSNAVEVIYKPMDISGLQFLPYTSSGPAANTLLPCLVIYFSSFNSPRVDISAIAHIETLGGALASADDIDDNTVSMDIPLERLKSVYRGLPAVKSGLAVSAEDNAFRAAMFKHQGTRVRHRAPTSGSSAATSSGIPSTLEQGVSIASGIASNMAANIGLDDYQVLGALATGGYGLAERYLRERIGG